MAYAGRCPSEIIWTETCYGNKPEGYSELYVYVLEKKQIIRMAEGDGDKFPVKRFMRETLLKAIKGRRF